MKTNYLRRSSLKKYLVLLLITLIMQGLLINNRPVQAAAKANVEHIYNEKIARGIMFQEHKYNSYPGFPSRSEREFIITADLNDPTVKIITGKAQDKVLKLETLSKQIAREQLKGQNVVAGINGDMYNMSLGTADYGIPLGLQVKDGKILVSSDSVWAGSRFPVFAITKNRQPLIDYISLDAKLSVVDASYEAKHGVPNPHSALTTTIDIINRTNTALMADQMILVTPQLTDNPTVGFTDEQAMNGTLTVLKITSGSGDGSIQISREYEADVVSVSDTATGLQHITVPADGMVLASQGVKASWVRQHIKKGDKIRFSVNLKDRTGKNLYLDQAVSAWLPLVENGHALTAAEMLEKCKDDWGGGTAIIQATDKARTAVGYTADHKVIGLVFDGGGEGQDSYGMDLPGMAVRMKELGAVAAVSLDGGGSSQINSRLFGETEVQLRNRPSDTKERPVTNTILFVSDVPKASDIKELKVNRDITIYKNSSYAFQVRGQDSYGNPADLTKTDIRWDIRPLGNAAGHSVSGTIDQKGLYVAGNRSTTEAVYAGIGPVQSYATVTIVDAIHSLDLTDSGMLAVAPNGQKQFQLLAYAQDGRPIIISNSAAQWSVTPSTIGNIDNNGLFTTKGKGNGTVTAKVDDKEVSINVVVGQESQLIDSYETLDTNTYSITGYAGGSCQISRDQVKHGSQSLRVDYDYSRWARVYNGTINVIMNADKRGASYTSTIRPKKLGMWVYGDGQAPWLRVNLCDGNGNRRTLNLASRIDWVGWKYVDVDIPADIPLPVSLDYFYMVETDKSKNLRGTVYFDDVRFIY